MSSPRHGWWPYVKYMIRRYPELKAEREELQQQTVTQQLSGMPGCGGIGRTAEQCAIRELSGVKQREFESVQRAEALTQSAPHTGQLRMDLIDLVFWKQSHTLEGAAVKLNCSYRTARRYQSEFIYLVAKNYGLMDE